MSELKLSLVIPCRDRNDPKLAELLKSIEAQDFPKDEMETLVITEGTSESAKAIGIRRAKGEVIGILASDNELMNPLTLSWSFRMANEHGSSAPAYYYYKKDDDILNRYFSLIGGNDPLSFYMRKNDRWSYIGHHGNESGSIGDNGFFIKKNLIEKTDIDNYYHVDNALEACGSVFSSVGTDIWHKTGGNIFKFFAKRYRYGLQHAFNKNRRWHLVEKTPKDIGRLIWFIFVTLTVMEPLYLSIRGFLKIRDVAWFFHWPVCAMTVFTYGVLIIHLFLKRLSQSLFALMAAQRA